MTPATLVRPGVRPSTQEVPDMSDSTRQLLIPRWPEPTLEDACEYMGATPPPTRGDVAPIWIFPVDKRREIERAVLADSPPEKWLYFVGCRMESRAWYEWHWHRGIDPDGRRPSIPTWMRERVVERDGLVCQLCFEPVERSDVHLDHILAYSKGGPTTVGNLRVTHSLCNIKRGIRD